MPGSLVFGAAVTDRVDCGSAAGLDNLTVWTWILYVYVTTLTSLRMFVSKDAGAGALNFFCLNGTTGNIQIQLGRATTQAGAISTDTPITVNNWHCIAGIGNMADATRVCRLYSGIIGTAPVERAYSGTFNGSGAQAADAAQPLVWANNGVALALQGRIGPAAAFGAALSLADIQSWARRPRATVGATVALDFHRFGNEGAGNQQDYSGNGNTGTVTGATQGDGPPLDQGELTWERDTDTGLYRMSA